MKAETATATAAPTNPTYLSEQVEKLWRLKSQRAILAAEDKKLKATFDEMSDELIQQLQSVGATAASSDEATAELTLTATPKVTDREAFRLHIIQSGELDLLEDRPARGAIRERWRTGEQVPGITAIEEFGLSLKKR